MPAQPKPESTPKPPTGSPPVKQDQHPKQANEQMPGKISLYGYQQNDAAIRAVLGLK